MLTTMRRFSSGFISKILMLLLVVTFGAWGINDVLHSNARSHVATVGGEPIRMQEFTRAQAMMQKQLQAMGMDNVGQNITAMAALRQLIQQKLVGLTLVDMGLYVNEDVIKKTLRAEPNFQRKDGSFNAAAYHANLKAMRVTEPVFLSQLKQEIGGGLLLDSLNMEDVTVPASVASLNATAARETRDAWILTVNPPESAPEINEESLRAFYEKNKSVLYVKPETRTLDYISLTAEQLNALMDARIDPALLAEAAKAHPSDSQSALQARLRKDQRERIVQTVQDALNDALAGGADFATAVRATNIEAPVKTLKDITDGFSKINADETLKMIAEQGLKLPQGETSNLMIAPNGHAVMVHVAAITATAPLAFDAVRDDVRAHVSEEKRREATQTRVQEIRAALQTLMPKDTPHTLDEAALKAVFKKFNLTARAVKKLERPTGKVPTNAEVPSSLHQAIFERQVGDVAGPLARENGSQLLAVVAATHHPAAAVDIANPNDAEWKKALASLTQDLATRVQGAAFASFTRTHTVEVDPRLAKSMASPNANGEAAE